MDLLNGNIRKIYFQYLFAALGSALIVSIYSLVDMIAVGQYEGPVGSAAMACLQPMFTLFIALGLLFGIGGSVMLSIARGRGDEDKGNRFFTAATVTALVVSAVITMLFALLREKFLILFGADAELLPYCMDYTYWLTMAVPFFLMAQVLSAFLRNDGAPFLATLSTILGGGFNIFGDIFFVFTCDMGIGGAGLATFLGQVISTAVLLIHFFRKKNTLRFLRPVDLWGDLKGVFSAGFAPFIVDISLGVTVAIFNNQIIRLSDSDHLAVYGVVSNCIVLFQSMFYGIGQSIQPIVSVNHGAGKSGRVRQVLGLAMGTALVMGVLFCGAVELFPGGVLRLFMDVTESVLGIGPAILRVYAISFLLMGFNIVGSYYFQSILKNGQSLLISLLRGFILCAVLVLVFPALFGFSAIWWAMPVTELGTLCVALVLLARSGAFRKEEHLA